MTLELSHFTAAVLFSVFASVVFGITQRNTAREQIRYGLLLRPVRRRVFSGMDGLLRH
jgi:hypothetical protein